jgi:hypothetical protein
MLRHSTRLLPDKPRNTPHVLSLVGGRLETIYKLSGRESPFRRRFNSQVRCMVNLTNSIEQTSMAIYGRQESKSSRPLYGPIDIQKIQRLKEATNQAAMLLESNANVMNVLHEYYTKLLENEDFPFRTSCQRDIQEFATDMESNIVCIRMQVRQLGLLADTINDRKNLVRSIVL